HQVLLVSGSSVIKTRWTTEPFTKVGSRVMLFSAVVELRRSHRVSFPRLRRRGSGGCGHRVFTPSKPADVLRNVVVDLDSVALKALPYSLERVARVKCLLNLGPDRFDLSHLRARALL